MNPSVAILLATLNTLEDAILAIFLQKHHPIVNQKCIELWSLPDNIVQVANHYTIFSYIAQKIKKPEVFIQKMKEVSNESIEEIRDRLELIDGRLIDYTSKPQHISGQVIGRIWQFREVTQYYQVEQQFLKKIEQLENENNDLKEHSLVDALTKIGNRRQLTLSLTQEWQRMSREKSNLSLLLCDLDYFQIYNHIYGKKTGDNCLQQIAVLISLICRRPGDLVTRYGADKFALLLPNTHEAGAVYVAHTIRKQLQVLRLEHAGSKISNFLTISIGICSTIPSLENLPDTLLVSADRALLQAKEEGRNNIIYQPLTLN